MITHLFSTLERPKSSLPSKDGILLTSVLLFATVLMVSLVCHFLFHVLYSLRINYTPVQHTREAKTESLSNALYITLIEL